MTVDVKLLQSMAYFRGLSSAELESIKALVKETHVLKGEHFISEGQHSDYLYFIASGLVKVYKTSSGGKEQVLHIAPPGDSLNDVSLFDGSPTAASMVALTPVILYTIRKDDIIKLLWKNPQMMMNVIHSLASVYAAIQTWWKTCLRRRCCKGWLNCLSADTGAKKILPA